MYKSFCFKGKVQPTETDEVEHVAEFRGLDLGRVSKRVN